jgi:predicted ArsR family transcriptional regulator
METSILELLAHHESLADDQIAALVRRPTETVLWVLASLRQRGLVEVMALEREANGPTYWRLTDAGRASVRKR